MKAWYKSKTLWVNAIAAGLVAFEAAFEVVKTQLDTNLYVLVAMILPVVNAMMRVLTTQAIIAQQAADEGSDA